MMAVAIAIGGFLLFCAMQSTPAGRAEMRPKVDRFAKRWLLPPTVLIASILLLSWMTGP